MHLKVYANRKSRKSPLIHLSPLHSDTLDYEINDMASAENGQWNTEKIPKLGKQRHLKWQCHPWNRWYGEHWISRFEREDFSDVWEDEEDESDQNYGGVERSDNDDESYEAEGGVERSYNDDESEEAKLRQPLIEAEASEASDQSLACYNLGRVEEQKKMS